MIGCEVDQPHPQAGRPGASAPGPTSFLPSADVLLDRVEDAIVVLDRGLDLVYANAAAVRDLPALSAVHDGGGHVDALSLIHPDDLEAVAQQLADLMARPGGTSTIRGRVVADEGYRPVEVVLTNDLDRDGVHGLIACFRDLRPEVALAQSLAEQQALREQLVEREQMLAWMLRIQTAVSGRQVLEAVLDLVIEAASELVGARVTAIRLADPTDPARLSLVAVRGIEPSATVGLRNTPAVEGVSGAAYLSGAPVVRNDYAAFTTRHPGPVRNGVVAAVAVPIHVDGAVVGALSAGSLEPRLFDDHDVGILTALADHAGAALRDAKSVETLRVALTDVLTGLANRRLLLDRLGQSLDRARRQHSTLAVLFIDLDGFKSINDGRGHQIGDRLLAEVARRIEHCIRSIDIAARWGGDEFVVVLEGAAEPEALDVSHRILAAISEAYVEGDVTLYLSATVGVCVADSSMRDPDLLVRRADIAMYRGKSHGRARVEVFSAPMEDAVVERTQLEVELLQAVRGGAIDVAYQPMIDLSTMQVTGVEALARWTSPSRGPIAPDQFIRIAEALGVVHELDRVVLRTASAAIAAMPGTLSLSVNIAAQHFDRPGFVSEVVDVLDTTGLASERLVIEVTESAAMHDPALTAAVLERLRSAGVRIAIDDFGTGYSSLSYLQRFLVDTIKVDRSFVAKLDDDREHKLAAAVVSLAHVLDLDVVAEGVETQDQLDALKGLGADGGQGFLLARPMSLDALRAWLQERPSSVAIRP
jgi:diguanylate cyclase (GGDEF)-like protein